MSYDLYNQNDDYFWANISTWFRLISVARANGWTPIGTINDDVEDWGGGYDTNDGQTICQEDAANLANALKRGFDTGLGFTEALSDDPTYALEQRLAMYFRDSGQIACDSARLDNNAFREKLAEAAEFFRKGSVQIF